MVVGIFIFVCFLVAFIYFGRLINKTMDELYKDKK